MKYFEEFPSALEYNELDSRYFGNVKVKEFGLVSGSQLNESRSKCESERFMLDFDIKKHYSNFRA